MSFHPEGIPRLRPGAEASRLGGEFVVLDASGRMLRGLNATAARVWEMMDGVRSARGIAGQLAREYHVPEDQVLKDVIGFLEMLAEKGLLDRSPGADGLAGEVR